MIPDKKPEKMFPKVDCHFHIIDPIRFPLSPAGGYRPKLDETGTAEEFAECMKTHGVSHGIAVQPSGYGFNNSAMLDAMSRSNGRIKGIAVVPSDISERDISWLAEAGVVGIRFNLIDFDAAGLEQAGARRLLERIKEIGWFAEVQCKASAFPHLVPLLRQTGVKVLIDHLGRPDPKLGIKETGFKQIIALADSGRAIVKLSGAFRESHEAYPHADLDLFVKNLMAAYTPCNLIWGSDWPFLNLTKRPGYRQTMRCLERWLPDKDHHNAVLWETPARLFNFNPWKR